MPRSITEVAAHVVVLTLAVVLMLAGLRSDRGLPLIAGVVLVVAALGPDWTRLSLKGSGISSRSSDSCRRRDSRVMRHGFRAVFPAELAELVRRRGAPCSRSPWEKSHVGEPSG